MALVIEADEAFQPGDVRLFRSVAEMTDPHGLPHLVQQVRTPRCG